MTDRLSRICTELEISPPVARQFVADYLGLLDARLERIERELDVLDTVGAHPVETEEAVVALLSLEASSSMLGAYQVALCARRLRVEVQTGRTAAIGEARRALGQAVEQARTQLSQVSVSQA